MYRWRNSIVSPLLHLFAILIQRNEIASLLSKCWSAWSNQASPNHNCDSIILDASRNEDNLSPVEYELTKCQFRVFGRALVQRRRYCARPNDVSPFRLALRRNSIRHFHKVALNVWYGNHYTGSDRRCESINLFRVFRRSSIERFEFLLTGTDNLRILLAIYTLTSL